MKGNVNGPCGDNDNRSGRSGVERELATRQTNIEAAALKLRGRADLLDLALSTRRRMLQIQGIMEDLHRREEASPSRAEQELLRRELTGSMFQHRATSDRFRAIEIAMEPPMRLALGITWMQMTIRKANPSSSTTRDGYASAEARAIAFSASLIAVELLLAQFP